MTYVVAPIDAGVNFEVSLSRQGDAKARSCADYVRDRVSDDYAAHADSPATIEAARSAGCDGERRAESVGTLSETLNGVARELSRGRPLNDALALVGFRSATSESVYLKAMADDDAIGQIVADRYCTARRSAPHRSWRISQRQRNLDRARGTRRATGRREFRGYRRARARVRERRAFGDSCVRKRRIPGGVAAGACRSALMEPRPSRERHGAALARFDASRLGRQQPGRAQ